MLQITTLSLLSFLINQDAHALSCAHGFSDSIPSDMASNIPTNVTPYLIFADGYSDLEFSIKNAETDEIVEIEVLNLDGQDIVQLSPKEELQPNTEYEIYFYPEDDTHTAAVSFTTGSEADNETPETPEILDISRDYGWDMWGSWKWLDIELDKASEENIYRVEVATNAEFSNSEVIYTTSYDSYISVGSGLCHVNMNMKAGDVKWVKVSALDMAGNPSDVPEAYRRGCSSMSRSANAWLALFALPLIALRRRED